MESRAVIQMNGQRNGATLIIQKQGSSKWLFPGGTVNPNENPWEALFRALDEQFIDCQINDPLVVLSNFKSPIDDSQTTIYLVRVDGVVVPNPQKIADARWVDPVAESMEYKLSSPIIGSIILLRAKMDRLARQLSKPPPVLE